MKNQFFNALFLKEKVFWIYYTDLRLVFQEDQYNHPDQVRINQWDNWANLWFQEAPFHFLSTQDLSWVFIVLNFSSNFKTQYASYFKFTLLRVTIKWDSKMESKVFIKKVYNFIYFTKQTECWLIIQVVMWGCLFVLTYMGLMKDQGKDFMINSSRWRFLFDQWASEGKKLLVLKSKVDFNPLLHLKFKSNHCK